MFNIGPFELVVLAIVGLIVLGPDRLPDLTRDAVRLLRTLRDMATGARQQLRDELGPEFADVDLRNLNPRTAVQRAVFGDDLPDLRKYDPRRFNPGAIVRDTILGEDEPAAAADEPVKPVSMTKQPPTGSGGSGDAGGNASGNGSGNGSRPRPKPGPGRSSYDDAT